MTQQYLQDNLAAHVYSLIAMLTQLHYCLYPRYLSPNKSVHTRISFLLHWMVWNLSQRCMIRFYIPNHINFFNSLVGQVSDSIFCVSHNFSNFSGSNLLKVEINFAVTNICD